jgi:hypothetical protein
MGLRPLPNRRIGKYDAAYSGISAVSVLLAKVDILLERGERETLVIKHPTV